MHKKNKLLPLQSQNNGETNNGFVAHGATPRLDRVSKSNATPIRIRSFGIESLEVKSNLYGFVAQLDRASDYGSEGLGFESLRDHPKNQAFTR